MADVDTDIRRLQVANLPPADSGRGIARVPRTVMDALGLTDGDVIEIVGKRATPARAVRTWSTVTRRGRMGCIAAGAAMGAAGSGRSIRCEATSLSGAGRGRSPRRSGWTADTGRRGRTA